MTITHERHRQHMAAIYFRNDHPDAVEFTAIASVYVRGREIEAGDQVFATPLANAMPLPEDGRLAGWWWVLANPGARYVRISPDEFAAIGGALA